ncbi:capsular polysaccharide transport system permease protein [Neorhizobium sp. 2083]|uniref:ABC transporter permease n=1 Tax=Neorhizobium sp. 2083 TaxID=2817762 RepID=UPI002860C294|nr:ABC transporter permease [Neorhizobium sp. 2083]MDR6816452.1 capsular polysaccharide transport system permease protein [Neorhizobium sp. 2083]
MQGSPIIEKLNVMHAVILRDIRSRFFNHGLGFLIVPLFPLGHVIMLLVVYHIFNRQAVFGDDLQLFFATGLVPALAFSYVSRFMSISLVANKGMMAFPIVRLLDIILARAFLEAVAINMSVFVLFFSLLAAGSDSIPNDVAQAVQAFSVTLVLALGFGIIASVITAIFPMFAMIYGFSMVGFYLTSGAPIYLHVFPEQLVRLCAWNPVFHSVEWMRSSYYLGYPDQYLDKEYLVGFAFGSLAIGLVLERSLRAQILAGR